MLYPWLHRFPVLTQFSGFEIPEDCKKLRELKKLVEERPSVKETSKETGDEYLIERFRSYFHSET
jgi:hypothetical protein